MKNINRSSVISALILKATPVKSSFDYYNIASHCSTDKKSVVVFVVTVLFIVVTIFCSNNVVNIYVLQYSLINFFLGRPRLHSESLLIHDLLFLPISTIESRVS